VGGGGEGVRRGELVIIIIRLVSDCYYVPLDGIVGVTSPRGPPTSFSVGARHRLSFRPAPV